MEQKLQEQLREGETVLWTAAPSFQAMDNTHKKIYLLKVIIMIAASVGFICSYLSYLSASGEPLKIAAFVLVVLLNALILSPEPMDAKKLRNSLYALTDQRLISLVGGNVHSVELLQITQYELAEDADGQVSLLCGVNGVAAKPWQRRVKTIQGTRLNEQKTVCESFVMYGVTEADKLKKLLAKAI